MRILFSHVNFPSQFRRLIPFLVGLGHDIVFVSRQLEWHSPSPDGLTLIHYSKSRKPSSSFVHPYLYRFESAILEGQAVYRVAAELRDKSWILDCIISHVVEMAFSKECFPNAKRIGLVEWFYNSSNSDVDFLNHGCVSDDHKLRLRT